MNSVGTLFVSNDVEPDDWHRLLGDCTEALATRDFFTPLLELIESCLMAAQCMVFRYEDDSTACLLSIPTTSHQRDYIVQKFVPIRSIRENSCKRKVPTRMATNLTNDHEFFEPPDSRRTDAPPNQEPLILSQTLMASTAEPARRRQRAIAMQCSCAARGQRPHLQQRRTVAGLGEPGQLAPWIRAIGCVLRHAR